MTRYNRTKEKRTDPRPAHVHLGVDTEGGSHVYHVPSESVYTIEGTAVAYHEFLEGHPISTYLEYVADRRGWLLRSLDRRAADALQQWAEHTTAHHGRLEHTTRVPCGEDQ
ncbi:hypothetical protein [Saliphagus infecundisoli]|uniref:Uncharacterized protein n=1 Tax=Saliphagus infecundisoli TaxID=1849069 RepID=A0ABD5QJA9_9EURY|nr:hypothetical protein [Saliphagus infecundisoli]